MGYIPAGVDVFNLTEADRVGLAQSRDDIEFLKDAFWVVNGNVYVRGTRDAFPVIGPSCKYTALFDPRPVFDALRRAFLVHADPCLRVHTFQRGLKQMLDANRCVHMGWVIAAVFHEKILNEIFSIHKLWLINSLIIVWGC